MWVIILLLEIPVTMVTNFLKLAFGKGLSLSPPLVTNYCRELWNFLPAKVFSLAPVWYLLGDKLGRQHSLSMFVTKFVTRNQIIWCQT
jgi:hypothetical protein